MFNVKTLSIFLALFALSVEAQSASEQTSEDETMFSFLVAGFQSNIGKASSGEGSLISKGQGDYFARGAEKPRQFNAKFFFDGEKIRYDRTFDYGRNPSKDAKDGRFHFEFLEYPVDNKSYSTPNAYIRNKEFLSGGAFIGEIVDVKRIMEPQLIPLEDGLKVVEKGQIKVTMEEQSDGTSMARLLSEAISLEVHLWFDPEKGFNIVREKTIQDGVITDNIERTFQDVDGVWMLKSLLWTRYATEEDPNGKQPTDSTQYFEVGELKLNNQIPEDTFNLH